MGNCDRQSCKVFASAATAATGEVICNYLYSRILHLEMHTYLFFFVKIHKQDTYMQICHIIENPKKWDIVNIIEIKHTWYLNIGEVSGTQLFCFGYLFETQPNKTRWEGKIVNEFFSSTNLVVFGWVSN